MTQMKARAPEPEEGVRTLARVAKGHVELREAVPKDREAGGVPRGFGGPRAKDKRRAQ